MSRTNAITERWIRSCTTELLDRTLIWNQTQPLHALHEYKTFFNQHRPHRTLAGATPQLPQPLESDRLVHLDVRRRDRLGGILREFQYAA
ncbi:integrase core domain-containing protein [Streptomyces mirabilis]|uniref:integrase core domain-containing protein n=1 Tax=Streptomyces mirabilis TaxID=68239 RepID=UPI0033343DF0